MNRLFSLVVLVFWLMQIGQTSYPLVIFLPLICTFRFLQGGVRTRRPSLYYPVIVKLCICPTTSQQFTCSLLNTTFLTTLVYQVLSIFVILCQWHMREKYVGYLICDYILNYVHEYTLPSFRISCLFLSFSAHLKPVRPVKQPPAVCGPSQCSVDHFVFQGFAAHSGPGQSFLPFARQ